MQGNLAAPPTLAAESQGKIDALETTTKRAMITMEH